MKLSHLSPVLLGALLLASCSDSTTNPPTTTGPFFPLTSGSKWVYSTRTIDATTGDTSSTITYDTLLVVDASLSLGGRTGSMIQETHSDTPGEADSTAYSSDNSTAYVYLGPFGGSPDGWGKIVDVNATSEWTVGDITLPDGSGGQIQIHIAGRKEGTVSVATPAGTFNTTHYTQTSTSTYDMIIFGIPYHAVMTGVTHYYHASGVGFVKIHTEVPTVQDNGQGVISGADGSIQTLISYSVK